MQSCRSLDLLCASYPLRPPSEAQLALQFNWQSGYAHLVSSVRTLPLAIMTVANKMVRGCSIKKAHLSGAYRLTKEERKENLLMGIYLDCSIRLRPKVAAPNRVP